MTDDTPALEFIHISKSFADSTSHTEASSRKRKTKNSSLAIVKDMSFSVRKGEFFSFLGPSGCGKTTCLRMISGLERPTSGEIKLNGQVVNHVHPHKRNIHMVFQKYALFPHLNVFDNIAFGLRMKKVPEKEIKTRVIRMLKMIHLESYGPRPIQKLSGGEQQRIALARALVNEPAILLLDEPLGALDLKLREEMQKELAAIQKETGTTFIFVTHDQGEALTLSDRIAIMNKGHLEQVGTPTEIYESPASEFVAQFVGSNNMFSGHLTKTEGAYLRLETEHWGQLFVRPSEGLSYSDGSFKMIVRPEKIRLRVTPPEQNANHSINGFKGTLIERTYFGATTQIKLKINDNTPPLLVLVANQAAQKMPSLKLGEKYYAVWDAADSILVRPST